LQYRQNNRQKNNTKTNIGLGVKNAYLKGVLTFRVYLRVIKKKYIVNKPKKKTSKDSLYILVNCVERKTLNSTWGLEKTWDKRELREREWKCENGENWESESLWEWEKQNERVSPLGFILCFYRGNHR
jgi:hypothetical protein